MDNQSKAQTHSTGAAGIDFAEFLLLLWKNRVWISVSVLGAMVLAVGATFLVSKTFESRAKVLVETPRRRAGSLIFSDPLSVLAYRDLLNSDASALRVQRAIVALYPGVKKLFAQGKSAEEVAAMSAEEIEQNAALSPSNAELLSRLSASDVLGVSQFTEEELEELNLEKMRRKLDAKTSIETETGVRVEHSPIIDLSAEFDTPEKAALLANLWARTFVEHMSNTMQEKTGQVVEEILSVEESTQEKLESAVKDYEAYRKEVGIDELRQELHANSLSLFGLSVQKKIDIDPTTGMRIESTEVITEGFENALLPEMSQTEKRINARETRLILLNTHLAQLEDDGEWVGSISDRETLKENIEQSTQMVKEASAELSGFGSPVTLREKLQEVQARMEENREAFNRAQVASAADDMGDMDLLSRLEAEYRQMVQQAEQVEASLLQQEAQRKRLVGLQDRLTALQAKLSDLEQPRSKRGQMMIANENGAAVAGGVLETTGPLAYAWDHYLSLKDERAKVEASLTEDKAAYQSLQKQVSRLRRDLETLRRKIGLSEATLERLDQVRQSYARTLEELSQQASEARLESQRQEVFVRVHERAMPSEQKVAPRRSIWGITAGALVFLFAVVWLVVARLLEVNLPIS